MAKVTREQVNRWEAKLVNGFRFDLNFFLMWNDKRVKKCLKLEDGRMLEAVLEYRDITHNYAKVGVQPVLHLSVWESCGPDSGMMKSNGMGAYIEMGATQDKRKYNELVKLSAMVDDGKIMALALEKIPQLENAVIV